MTTHATGGPVDRAAERPGEQDQAVERRRIGLEIVIVLGLSLGQSAVYATINLIGKATAGAPIAQQKARLNAEQSPRPYLDLAYQLAGIAFALVPVALVLWLLAADGGSATRRIGLAPRHGWRDLGAGAALAAVIGVPGLLWYLVGRWLGFTADVVPAPSSVHWWTVPVLVLAAVKNGLLEEVVVVGYLLTRLRRLGWPAWALLAASSLLRGSYHLYQGYGPFLGNVVMGLVFAEWFRRRGRVLPLVIAHVLIDVVAFVGYYAAGPLLT
ncbi:MAG: CPBP family intramembrane metalloprotease [Actinomycetales bacterium]|nr:CPBP family intramembrane metalloprotease [Actinomycetales bacterium]